MRRPTLAVLPYRHSNTHRYYLDLRPFGQGRKFFKTKAEAEADRLRQITTLERHGREAVGLPPHELSAIVQARKKLATHGRTLRRCNVTVAQLAKEVLEAKKRDGHAPRLLPT
jgi:Mg-chelatase subunit ChlI